MNEFCNEPGVLEKAFEGYKWYLDIAKSRGITINFVYGSWVYEWPGRGVGQPDLIYFTGVKDVKVGLKDALFNWDLIASKRLMRTR